MILFDVLFAIIIIYLFIYCIYQLFFYIKARNLDNFAYEQEINRSKVTENKRLCVLIYATSRDKNLDKLLASLNNQDYSKDNYEVHVAFQKDMNDTNAERDFALGARIHNIQNPDFFSKDKALNLLIQKLLPEKNFDAFIFLGAKRIIGEKYLYNINKTITEPGVYVGTKITMNKNKQFAKRLKQAVISSYLKYSNRTYNLVRSMFNLPFLIDGENFVITSDVLNQIGYISVEDKDIELEYTLDLASNGIKSIYSPYIITGVDIKNYNFASPSLKNKIHLFSYYFKFLFFKDLTFKEFILFCLKPNSILVIAAYIGLLSLSVSFPQHVASNFVIVLGAFLFANFLFSIFISKMTASEVFFLIFYPFCLTWQKTKLYINNLTMRSIKNSKYEEENINSATVSAVVRHGKKDINCKLDLVSEDGMKKVVFREGNRFISTDLCLRMYDAMADMTYKLKSKDLTLKVCQNCEHFSISPDGTLDCVVGKCNVSQVEICIWNGCQYFYNYNDTEEDEQ